MPRRTLRLTLTGPLSLCWFVCGTDYCMEWHVSIALCALTCGRSWSLEVRDYLPKHTAPIGRGGAGPQYWGVGWTQQMIFGVLGMSDQCFE